MDRAAQAVTVRAFGHRSAALVADLGVGHELGLDGVIGLDVEATDDSGEFDELDFLVDADFAPTGDHHVPVRERVDHDGEPVTGPPKLVICRGFDPSILATQISVDPVRMDSKTMRDPSGEIRAPEFLSAGPLTLAGADGPSETRSATRHKLRS